VKFFGRDIDHLVYAVPNLDKAIDSLEQALGVRPKIGGQHLGKGTRNALLHLGGRCYLELLAADHDNADVAQPRWMGIDAITKATMTRWAISSHDLAADSLVLKRYNHSMGHISTGQRQLSNGELLKWQMIMPLALPTIEPVPFMIDWSSSTSHPTDSLDQLCRLERFELQISNNEPAIYTCLQELFPDCALTNGKQNKLVAVISGPKGTIHI